MRVIFFLFDGVSAPSRGPPESNEGDRNKNNLFSFFTPLLASEISESENPEQARWQAKF